MNGNVTKAMADKLATLREYTDNCHVYHYNAMVKVGEVVVSAHGVYTCNYPIDDQDRYEIFTQHICDNAKRDLAADGVPLPDMGRTDINVVSLSRL